MHLTSYVVVSVVITIIIITAAQLIAVVIRPRLQPTSDVAQSRSF